MMEVILDPDQVVTEIPTPFHTLASGDVYRSADVSLEAAITDGGFFMRVGDADGNCAYTINLVTGEFSQVRMGSMMVIVHMTKLVVIPN